MPGSFRLRATATLRLAGKTPDHLTYDRSLAIDEGTVHHFELPTGTTDQSLIVIGAAGGIETVTAIAVSADQTISVTLGAAGSNVAFQVSANNPMIVMGTSVTAVSFDNSSGSTANVTVMVGGT